MKRFTACAILCAALSGPAATMAAQGNTWGNPNWGNPTWSDGKRGGSGGSGSGQRSGRQGSQRSTQTGGQTRSTAGTNRATGSQRSTDSSRTADSRRTSESRRTAGARRTSEPRSTAAATRRSETKREPRTSRKKTQEQPVGTVELMEVADDPIAVEQLDCERRFTSTSGTLFENGKATLAAGADQTLAALGQMIRAAGAHPATVVGRADSAGASPANQRLAEQRAQALKTWLVARGYLKDARCVAATDQNRALVVVETCK